MAGRLSFGSQLHCGLSIYSLWLKCWSSSLSSTHHLQRETQRTGVTGTRAPGGSLWPLCHRTGQNILHLSWRERETWGETSTLCPYQQDVTMMTTSWGKFWRYNHISFFVCLFDFFSILKICFCRAIIAYNSHESHVKPSFHSLL